jgi:CRP-like cAMP-binding protein
MMIITEIGQLEVYNNQFPIFDYFEFDIRPFINIVRFESDELIFMEGEEPKFLYYLFSGRAKLFLSHENGRVSLINFLEGPCFIGEMELIEAQKYANGVKAITECTCFRIKISRCKDLILKDKKFLKHLCRLLAQKAIGNTYHYSRNQSYPLNVRLAEFLLLTSYGGYYKEKHTEVAEFLGVTYRHLLFVIAEYVKSGVLKRTNKGYLITDVDSLKNLANGGKE